VKANIFADQVRFPVAKFDRPGGILSETQVESILKQGKLKRNAHQICSRAT
jgi:hypothetical protein